jgi:hypothetical protein
MLKMAVLELIGECRHHLKEGAIVDMSEVERGIRTYCSAVAKLPLEEGRTHADDLNMLMEEVNGLNQDMVEAREALRVELEALEKLKQANTAYKKSDAIAGKHKKPEEES